MRRIKLFQFSSVYITGDCRRHCRNNKTMLNATKRSWGRGLDSVFLFYRNGWLFLYVVSLVAKIILDAIFHGVTVIVEDVRHPVVVGGSA